MNKTDFSTAQLSTPLQHYVALFAALTQEDVQRFDGYFAPDARFKDPFNDVRGIAAIQRIFAHMFATVSAPVFHIQSVMESQQQAVIHWHFHCLLANEKDYAIDGLSLVRFNAAGLVEEHLDYWDAAEQFYMRLPLIGSLLRLLAKRMRAS
jgi:steroid delta-isomerase